MFSYISSMSERPVDLDRLAGRMPKRNLLDPNPDAPEMAALTRPNPEPPPAITATVLLHELNGKLLGLGMESWPPFWRMAKVLQEIGKEPHNPVFEIVQLIQQAVIASTLVHASELNFDPDQPSVVVSEYTRQACEKITIDPQCVEVIQRAIAALTRESCSACRQLSKSV